MVGLSNLSSNTLEFRARYLYNIGFIDTDPYLKQSPVAVLMRSKKPEELKQKIFDKYPGVEKAYELIIADQKISAQLHGLCKTYTTQLDNDNRKMYMLLVLAMWSAGLDAAVINTATGLSTTTVYRWMNGARDAGITYAVPKRGGRRLDDVGGIDRMRRFSSLIKGGMAPEEAAKDPHVNIDKELAARWLKIIRPFAPLQAAPAKPETKE
ncbi:MAG: hypothetical protein KGH66_00810 [Candidatus Micrarchaeota archaeon]|nr:hypothetical protein [Candidatus Micrarchaeota archaeon]